MFEVRLCGSGSDGRLFISLAELIKPTSLHMISGFTLVLIAASLWHSIPPVEDIPGAAKCLWALSEKSGLARPALSDHKN